MGLAIMGLISGGHALGGAVGAFLGGYLFDIFARYSELWTVTFATAIMAGLLVFMLRESKSRTELVSASI